MYRNIPEDKRPEKGNPLPPQIFNEDCYCGVQRYLSPMFVLVTLRHFFTEKSRDKSAVIGNYHVGELLRSIFLRAVFVLIILI